MALACWEPETGKGPALLTDDLWPADLATRLLAAQGAGPGRNFSKATACRTGWEHGTEEGQS